MTVAPAPKRKRRASIRLLTALTLADLRAVARFHVENGLCGFPWFTLGHVAGSLLRRFEPSRTWPECSPEAVLGMRLDPRLRVFPTRADVPPPVIAALERAIAHSRDNPSTPGQDKLAELFGVNLAMRKELRLRMIGATDLRYAERKKASSDGKRERNKARKKAQRQERGATPREESLAAMARDLGIKPATLRARLRREKEKAFGVKVQGDENATSSVTFSSPRPSRREGRYADENVTPKPRPRGAVDTDTRRARARRAGFVRTADARAPDNRGDNLDIAPSNAQCRMLGRATVNTTVDARVRNDRASADGTSAPSGRRTSTGDAAASQNIAERQQRARARVDAAPFAVAAGGAPSSAPPRSARLRAMPIIVAAATCFRVGKRFVWTLSLSSSGALTCAWRPRAPKRLSKPELADYRRGRDSFLAGLARAAGRNILLVEPGADRDSERTFQ